MLQLVDARLICFIQNICVGDLHNTGFDRLDLGQDVHAVAILGDHARHTLDLPRNAVEALDLGLAAIGVVLHRGPSSTYKGSIPLGGI